VNAEALLGLAGRVGVLALGAAVLLLNAVALPGNWVLLVIATAYAWMTDFVRVGWVALAVMAGLAVIAEVLELIVGLTWTAKHGATRRGTFGAFVGGLIGAVATAQWVPPFGAMLGAFGGSFAGAYVFEYTAQRRRDAAMRAGRAAFIGRIVAAAVKTLCGFWMWCVLAWQLLAPRA
jgi:uncharacterized protein YqgC (DUF456 family)